MHRLVFAFRRRAHDMLKDAAEGGGLFFDKHRLSVGEGAWFARDCISLQLASWHLALGVLSRNNLITDGRCNAAVKRMSTEDVVAFYKAVGSLPMFLRRDETVVVSTEIVSDACITQVDTWSANDAASFMRQVPNLALAQKTSAVFEKVIQLWVRRLAELSLLDAKTFLQTIGSQLVRYDQSDRLSRLDLAALDDSIDVWFRRHHCIRSLVPQVMVMYAKFHERGLSLSPKFAAGLKLYLSLDKPQMPMRANEALRALHPICRVRMVQKTLVFEAEANALMDIVVRDASENFSGVDGVDLAILFNVLATNFADRVKTASASSTQLLAEKDEKKYLTLDFITARMTPLVPSLTFRGFLSFCRAATQLSFRLDCLWSKDLCEALALRCEEFLHPVHGALRTSPLLEQLTCVVAVNVFWSRTARTRTALHGIAQHMLAHRIREFSATEMSMLFSSLAWAFGVPIGSGEIMTSDGCPVLDSAEIRRRGCAHEMDPALLHSLIEHAALTQRMSQYAYSATLRSFCRLGLEHDVVAPFVARLLTLRHDMSTENKQKQQLELTRHSSQTSQTGDSGELQLPDVSVVPQGSGAIDPSVNTTWLEKSLGWCLLSQHMSEMVLTSLVSIKCTDATVNGYALMSVRAHVEERVPEHIKTLTKRLVALCPQVEPLAADLV